MKLLSFSLPNKIALSILVLLCVGLVPLVYLTANTLHANLEKQLLDQQFTYTSFVANDLEKKIELRINTLQDLAKSLPADKIKDRAAINAYLEKRIAIYRLFSLGVVVINRDGFGVADYPHAANRQNADFRELEYFQQVVSTGKVAIGKPRVGRFTKQLGVGIAVPIIDKHGLLVGVMTGFLALTDPTIFDQSKAKMGKSGEYVLVSIHDKTIIIDTDDSHTLQPVTALGKDPDLNQFIAGREGSTITKFIHGQKALTSAKHLLGGRWLLLAILPTKEAFAPINDLESQILKNGSVVFLIIATLMWLLTHRELKPLTTAARLISKMEPHGQKPHEVPVKSNDEVGKLLTAFNNLQKDLHASYAQLEQQAHQDFLTGLANRRYFLELAEQEISRSIRYGSSLAVCMLDIDFFKKVNDTYGHKVGDVVLKKLSALFGESLRIIDIAGRIGGEEFAIVLPQTDKNHALEVAERVRQLVESTKITLENGPPLRFTVSIGVAMFEDKDTNIDILLHLADQALYQAKNTGRNRVCMATSNAE
jgi:diguanylate cyclase (GGDEF)-like protein